MKPTREEALAIAAERKAARGARTSRIRKLVATLAVAAFIGPFAVIYENVAAGKDPALAAQTTVARASTTSDSASTTSDSASTTTSDSASTTTDSAAAPAAVTTQQS
jgi:hypothetical protein